eukprot:7558371-Lingulodinium_polyedra.AAC.1
MEKVAWPRTSRRVALPRAERASAAAPVTAAGKASTSDCPPKATGTATAAERPHCRRRAS